MMLLHTMILLLLDRCLQGYVIYYTVHWFFLILLNKKYILANRIHVMGRSVQQWLLACKLLENDSD